MPQSRQSAPLEAPVAFFVFNRPDLTAQVFESIRRARPKRLLVVADGARNEAEKARVQAVRDTIQVDWDCRVQTNYSDVNLGCRRRVSSGIDWVFQECEEAIILEDDTLPSPSFFPFCENLLKRYRTDDRVVSVVGMNHFPRQAVRGPETYYFTRYGHTNGWATWRRAWAQYDVTMAKWPEFKRSGRMKDLFQSRIEQWWWTLLFDSQYAGQIDTWDYQWIFTRLVSGGVNAVPIVNMVANLGFRADATHTAFELPKSWQNVAQSFDVWDVVHPDFVLPNHKADRYYFDEVTNPMGAVGLASFGARQLAKSLKRNFG